MECRVPLLLFAGLLIFATALNAQQRDDRPRKLTIKSFIEGLSSAVDAQGVRHRGRDYAGPVPWIHDAIKTQRPKYPYEQRVRYIGGMGVVRVTLDLSTGAVSNATMVRSTGVPALDSSAMTAFHQWQWRPGKWKEIDVPITFASGPRSPGAIYFGLVRPNLAARHNR
jgi:TonB family protein